MKTPKKPKQMTDADLQKLVGNAVDTAINDDNDAVSEKRIKAQKYYDGGVSIGQEKGRSKVVATKCRDVVRQVKPSLLRVFLSNEKPVEFVPRTSEDVQAAEQATKYVAWKFEQQNGYRVLSDGIHDALVKKVGIAKAYWEESKTKDIQEFSGLSELEFTVLGMNPDVEFIENSEMDGIYEGKIAISKSDGDIRISSVPPEEFFIDTNATSIDDFTVCGHENDMTIADLVAMGIDYDDVKDLPRAGSTKSDEEEQLRNGTAGEEDGTDPMMRKVTIKEAYMRVDVEGAGEPSLYAFILGGPSNKILRKDIVEDTPFAVFEVDPEPHTFYGHSLVDIVMDDQDAATSMLRGVLDNVALSNSPGMTVIEDQVNMDDVLNNEIGAIRRVKAAGAITPDVVPFIAGQTLPALAYYDGVVEGKTGVSRASLGLDPDALQNATATAVNATVNGGNGQSEVMARNLAEGVKRLFKIILKLTKDHVTDEAMMQINGQFVAANPGEWDPTMDMSVNVGLGSGQDSSKMAVLQMTAQTQQGIWGQFGPSNGLVTMTGMRNTLADMMALGGIRNADRYYQPMTPEIEQQLLQQQAQQAQQQEQGSDPNAAFLQSEQMKVQQRAESDQGKLQAEMRKADMADDLARDKMIADSVLKAADLLGKYNIPVDLNAINRMQQGN